MLRRKNKEIWKKLRIDHAPDIYNKILADIEVEVLKNFSKAHIVNSRMNCIANSR